MKVYKLKKIAILLAAHNGEKYLSDQLVSILNQTYENFDLYISLDKSTDTSLSILKKFHKKFRRVKLLNYSNIKYGSSTLNFFRLICQINFKTYDYVAFADQDDIWFSNKLKIAFNFLNNNKKYFGYSSNVIAFNKSNSKKKLICKSQKQTTLDYYFEGGGPGNTILLRSEVIEKIKIELKNNNNFYNNFKHHDWMIYAYVRHFYKYWYIDKNPTLYYRQHHENELGARNNFKSYLKRINLVLSGYAINQSRLLVDFLKVNEDNLIKKILNKNRISGLFIIINFYKLRRSKNDKIMILFIGLLKLIKII